MCVGLSAKVVSVNEGTAVIDASGAKREVSADLIDDLEVGGLCHGTRRGGYRKDNL